MPCIEVPRDRSRGQFRSNSSKGSGDAGRPGAGCRGGAGFAVCGDGRGVEFGAERAARSLNAEGKSASRIHQQDACGDNGSANRRRCHRQGAANDSACACGAHKGGASGDRRFNVDGI